ncbi:MAG TPA: NUDIX domain-containing protein [Streptosporangiaceae bacterium]|jgi:8-oxo-dGTP diphosphatase
MADHRAEPGSATLSKLAEIEAAGVVPWRRGPDGPEVLLVHRPQRDDWSLAKGKREPGEELPETAIREVAEEAGLRLLTGRRLETVHYLVGGRPKRVEFWAATEPARPGHPAAFVPNDEVDEVCWFPLPHALERLSYATDVSVLNDFARWPHRTVPLVVLRHASAGHKKDWAGDDLLRPLDVKGQSEARTLVSLLGCFGPVRVVSSPAARCLATIEPYAGHVGAPVLVESALMLPRRSTSADQDTHPEVVGAVRRLLADGIPTVICAHRENIPDILAVACEYLNAPPPPDASLRKSSFWVLQAAESMLAGMERYDLSGLLTEASVSGVSGVSDLTGVSGASETSGAAEASAPADSAGVSVAASARACRVRRCLRTRRTTSATTATASAIKTYSEYRVIWS